ncbi:threonine aldolase family protein [Niallia sp. 03133]|uniref:threonine aldolase family protein n=1 Tax=Niallia sp. 03133 TaxID=3458060 RepID=UPI004044A2AA
MIFDFRTDAGTLPTEEMRQAMYNAMLGDDYYGEDPSVALLEKDAAELFNKESALLTTSATLANQLALLAQQEHYRSIWLEEKSHIATHAYVKNVWPDCQLNTYNQWGVHASLKINEPSIVCMENTHNIYGGKIIAIEDMAIIYQKAKQNNCSTHLDGTRLFHAQIETGKKVSEYARFADTVTICLTKGLSAPVGGLLVGSEQVIKRARDIRLQMGGGMAQAGIIAAPGHIALMKMWKRLKEDHDLAKFFALEVKRIENIHIDLNQVQTNIVLVKIIHPDKSISDIIVELSKNGVLVEQHGDQTIRFVFDRRQTKKKCEKVIQCIKKVMKTRKNA